MRVLIFRSANRVDRSRRARRPRRPARARDVLLAPEVHSAIAAVSGVNRNAALHRRLHLRQPFGMRGGRRLAITPTTKKPSEDRASWRDRKLQAAAGITLTICLAAGPREPNRTCPVTSQTACGPGNPDVGRPRGSGYPLTHEDASRVYQLPPVALQRPIAWTASRGRWRAPAAFLCPWCRAPLPSCPGLSPRSR